MIYFFTGEDIVNSLSKANSLAKKLIEKKPDASLVSLDDETITNNSLNEVSATQGLFERKLVVLFKNVLQNDELKEEILERIPTFASSENIFIWVEGKLLAKEIALLKKHSEKVVIDEKKAKAVAERFNTFSLTDAFGARDKKKLFVLLNTAFEKGIASEEIHGILWWQLKTIVLASVAKTATEVDLKPFVFSKAKSFSKNFSKEELDSMLDKMVSMYHEAHLGNLNFPLALEEFALSI